MNAVGKTSALGLLIFIFILVPDSSWSIKGHKPNGDNHEQKPWKNEEDEPFLIDVFPEINLFPGENSTVVCEAFAGHPAAQISWTPNGDCKTESETLSNGTVTVRSTCHWENNNVCTVFCLVSHSIDNKILSLELNQAKGVNSTLHSLLTILYVKLSILGIILLIIGFVFFQKKNHCRK